ncbi:hypothetical protein TNCV_1782681 [Trichonephila clavipes]|nr:hypothetical protein TNCV_1782681 [Trichonephila clavipes]
MAQGPTLAKLRQHYNVGDGVPYECYNFCHRKMQQKNHPKAVGSLVVRTSDSRPQGLGSVPDATKYPPSTHGDFDELNRTVTSMVLKATAGIHLAPCPDVFRGSRSDTVDQVGTLQNPFLADVYSMKGTYLPKFQVPEISCFFVPDTLTLKKSSLLRCVVNYLTLIK